MSAGPLDPGMPGRGAPEVSAPARRRTVDVSTLPDSGFGDCSGPWWGTLGFIAAEGTTLALCAATYLYLSRHYSEWPPVESAPPDLLLPTISAVWLLLCLIPAWLLGKAARRKDPAAVTKLLLASVAIEVVAVALRAMEFAALNVRWDTNSYGSILWWTLGIHTTLLLADLAETGIFAAIFVSGHAEEKHFADADDVAFYWRFVALSWAPLYALIYLAPHVV